MAKKLTKYEKWREEMGDWIFEGDESLEKYTGDTFQHLPALLHCFLRIPKGVTSSYKKFLKQQKRQ